MRKFISFCLFFLLSSSLFSSEFLRNPEGCTVHSIQFKMQEKNGGVSESSSLNSFGKNLQTQVRSLFSQNDFDRDLKFLAQEFDSIEPDIIFQGNEIDIIITVSEKPFIASFTLSGNSALSSSKIMKEGDFHEKKKFDRELFFKGIQKVRALYIKKGYFEIDILPKISEKLDNSLDIHLEIKEGKTGFIHKILFHNFTQYEQEILQQKMLTKTYNPLFSWINRRGIYHADQFQHDEMMVLSYLQNQGFLDAKITSQILPSPKNDKRIIIDIATEKGEKYHFGKIAIDSDQTLFSQEKLLQTIGFREGDSYSPDAIRFAVKRIHELFGSKGYIDAVVIPDTKRGDAPNTYDTLFRIQQGLCFRVGLIRIIGNKRTDISVILHEVPLTPGEIFNSTYLAKAEARLFNVGFFKKVNIYAVKSQYESSENLPLRDIHIEVEENPTTAQFSAFGGYNSTEKVSLGCNVSESNFKMSGIPSLFSQGFRSIRGGGEYIKLNGTFGSKQRSYSLSWTKPYFFDTEWALGVDLSKMNNEFASEDYTIQSKEAEISLKRNINAFVSFGTHYRLHDGHIKLRGMSSRELKKKRNQELIRESKKGGTISAIGISLGYDSTNHPISPSYGIRSSVLLEYAGLFGNHHFATAHYTNTLFFPGSERGVFRLKANASCIHTFFKTKLNTLPMDERLFLGGEGSVRGYRFNALGPLFKDKQHTPRGGLTSALLSLEYEHRILSRLGGFIFTDAGNIWKKTLQFGRLQYSTGFGIKFYIAEGTPLTLGYGFPLNAQKQHQKQRFYFSIGANF